MPDGGILLALPAQSVAVRLLLGALTAFVLVRVLLRANFRLPRVRVAFAVLPVAALLGVGVASLTDPRLPTLMVPAQGSGQVVVGLGGDYLYLAPLTLPAIVAAWATVAATRMVMRLLRTTRASRRVRAMEPLAEVPARIRRPLVRLCARLGITAPRIVLADCPGGAAAVGIRQPVLLLDEALAAALDDRELEGVIAHELAHVARRDNLVALLYGLGRDLTFFIPGGNWALRHLLVERELAADQAAIDVTARPGALAGGLLKVLEGVTPKPACAALMPDGTLAVRVAHLCEEQPSPSRLRTAAESASVLTAFVGLVSISLLVPRWAAGADPEAGLGVLLSNPPGADEPIVTEPTLAFDPEVEARALATYHTSVDRAPSPPRVDPMSPDDHPNEITAGLLRTCDAGAACSAAPPPARTLELRPEPLLVDRELDVRWHARQVADTGDMVRFYYLSSLR